MVGFLGGAVGGAAVNIIIRAVDKYSKEFKKLDKGLKKQESSFKKLGRFLDETGIGYAAIAAGAGALGIAAIKAGLESERAMQQFNLAVGETAETMLTDMRKASKGMVSDFQLVQNANAALALGISRNQIPQLLEVATARAKVFGRTTSEAFNDISIGIGRQSRMILDNLGIIINLEETYKRYALTLGKSVEELTEFEKKAALTNSILKESESLVRANIFLQETHSEKLQRLTATYNNALDASGLYFLELLDVLSGTKAAEEENARYIDSLTGLEGTYEEVARATIELGDAERALTADLRASNDEAKNLMNSLLNLKDVTFKGERAGTLEIAKTKELIRELELKKKNNELQAGEAQLLVDSRGKLEELRSKQESFANQREIQQAENAVKLEEIGELESSSFENFIRNEDQKFIKLEEERKRQELLRKDIKKVQDTTSSLVEVFSLGQEEKEKGYDLEEESIDALIKKTNDLTEAYIRAMEARGGAGSSGPGRSRLEMLKDLGKGIISPFVGSFATGGVIPETGMALVHKGETVIPKGGGGVTLIVQGDLIGVSAEQISRALSDELNNKLSL